MDSAFSSFDESDSLEIYVNCFYELLYEQLDKIAPRRACKPREGSHWWTPELSSMREEIKHLLAHKKNLIMAKNLGLSKEVTPPLFVRREVIIGTVSIRKQNQPRRSALWYISAEESLDFLHKQHFPLHLLLPEEEQFSEEVGKFMNSDRSEEILQ